jgi:hypothetical protein
MKKKLRRLRMILKYKKGTIHFARIAKINFNDILKDAKTVKIK